MNQTFIALSYKVNNLKTRERVLLFIVLLSVVYVIWQIFLIDPLVATSNDLESKKQNLIKANDVLNKEYIELTKNLDQTKIGNLSQQIKELNQENKELEEKIEKVTQYLIPPDKMLNVLRGLLAEEKNIKLVSLKNIEEVPLFSELLNKDEQTNEQSQEKGNLLKEQLYIYKHGIELELEGRFFDILHFLYELEKLKWNIIWDKFEYEVVNYPTAKIKINLFTISLSTKWLRF